jgi:hypothetical protein
MDVANWLRDLGLERYEATFRENDVNAELLPTLTADDLKEIGVTSFCHRRQLLEAIAVLRLDSTPARGPVRGVARTPCGEAASLSHGELRPHSRLVMVRLIANEQIVAGHQPNRKRTRLARREIGHLTEILDPFFDDPALFIVIWQGSAVRRRKHDDALVHESLGFVGRVDRHPAGLHAVRSRCHPHTA